MRTLGKYIIALAITLGGIGIPTYTQDVYAQKTKTSQQKKKKVTTKEEISSLKDKQSQLRKEIIKTDKKLNETKKSTKQSLRELERLNVDIQYRDQLIKRRSKEIDDFTRQIENLNQNVQYLSGEYSLMRQKYSDLIYQLYQRRNRQDKILFIFSGKSFQESYRRFQYLNNLATLRKEQAIDLANTRQDIQKKRDEIDRLKERTEELLQKQEKEKEFSLIQKEKQSNLIASLKEQEKELKKELIDQQKASERLNQKIQDMIAKEAAAAQKRKQTKAATKGGYAMTKAEKVVAGGFEKNKGLLMWPAKGVVTGKFGKQPHPVLKDVMVSNKGIYITAAPGTNACVVYDGTVSQCFSVPGNNNAVIVRHGNYLTVYANLTKIYVKAGTNIKRGTAVGKIYEDSDNKNKATLFFQVWKEKNLLNPQQWLKK